jgi:LysM repeat protein
MNKLLESLKGKIPSGDRLYTLLAVCVIALVLVGYSLLITSRIMPQAKARRAMAAQLAAAQKQLADAQKAQGSPETMQLKIKAAGARLDAAASEFITAPQAADMPARLSKYANEAGIEVISLQAQAGMSQGLKELYNISTFHLQASGALAGLTHYVSLIKETALKSFVITNLNVAQKKENLYTLTMDVVLYTSPHAGATPTPAPTAKPAATAAGATPAAASTAQPQPAATATPLPPQPAATATALPPQPTATVDTQSTTYTVRSGDTLYSIARRYNTSVQAIQAANGLSGNTIRPGQQLRIPR